MIKKFVYSQKVAPYVFVLPFIIIFLIFWSYPLVNSFVMSFQDRMLGQDPKWVGEANYSKLFTDKVFLTAIKNSVVYMLGTLVLLIPFPMLFAVMINSKLMLGREFLNLRSFFLH